jgi:hypothetical protein
MSLGRAKWDACVGRREIREVSTVGDNELTDTSIFSQHQNPKKKNGEPTDCPDFTINLCI